MKKILILVNKDFEYVGYRDGFAKAQAKCPLTPIDDPDEKAEQFPVEGHKKRLLKYRAERVFRLGKSETDEKACLVKEFCINYHFRHNESSSNSERKLELLRDLMAQEQPDFIVSVSSCESTPDSQGGGDDCSINGCVIVNHRCFMMDCQRLDSTTQSHLDFGGKAMLANSPIYEDIDKVLESTEFKDDVDGLMKDAPHRPATGEGKARCIADKENVSLGVINVMDYSRYIDADPTVYQAYCELENKIGKPATLETTHAIVKMAAGTVPVTFVSPVVDRYKKFAEDVGIDGNDHTQDKECSHNSGVVVPIMLKHIYDKLETHPYEQRTASKFKLKGIKEGMFMHWDVCSQARFEHHILMTDDKKRSKSDPYFKVDKQLTPDVPFKLLVNGAATAESDNVTIELFNDERMTDPAIHKYIYHYSELKDDNGVLKAVINSFNIEDYKDDDYYDVSIQIIAWIHPKIKK